MEGVLAGEGDVELEAAALVRRVRRAANVRLQTWFIINIPSYKWYPRVEEQTQNELRCCNWAESYLKPLLL